MPAAIKQAECLAEVGGAPRGLKAANCNGRISCDSTWVAGAGHDEEELNDELEGSDCEPSEDDSDKDDDDDEDDDDGNQHDKMDPSKAAEPAEPGDEVPQSNEEEAANKPAEESEEEEEPESEEEEEPDKEGTNPATVEEPANQAKATRSGEPPSQGRLSTCVNKRLSATMTRLAKPTMPTCAHVKQHASLLRQCVT